MKFLYATAALAALTLATPAAAGLDAAYQQQQAAKTRESNDLCRKWYQAQWSSTSGFGIGRIYQSPDGRLWSTQLRVNDAGKMECSRGLIDIREGYRLGNNKKLYSDGSGEMATLKIEGQELVKYSKGCLEWKCDSPHIFRSVVGSRLDPETKEKQHLTVENAIAKTKECIALEKSLCGPGLLILSD